MMLGVFVAAATQAFGKGGENPGRGRRIQFLTSITAKINLRPLRVFP
jgi:hypothetical protein